jgi:DNA-directed RNA polymerase sigma subunit (sigma70/sigma32)
MAIAGGAIAENSRSGADDRAAFLAALRQLDLALDENIDRARRMKQRIAELEDACLSGRPIKEIVPEAQTPPIVRLLTESAEALHEHGSRVRRAEARALHREGLTMDQIARLFGVTRQRVSALLRED